MAVASCATPQLLVAVQNTRGNTGDGRVLRYSLNGSSPAPCTTLIGLHSIGASLETITGFGSNIAVATNDMVYVIDPSLDTVSWSRPVGALINQGVVIDAFALQDQTGQPLLAVASGLATSSPAVRDVDVFLGDGSSPANTPWCIQGTCSLDLMLSLGIYGMSGDPKAPTHILAIDGANAVAAWTVDPYTQKKTQVVGNTNKNLVGIYALGVGATRRIVWIEGSTPNDIVYTTDTGGTLSGVSGPSRCGDGTCDLILHAVPDPTAPNGYFLLCDGTSASMRKVVSLDATTGKCTTVVNGPDLDVNTGMARLAIMQ
jgi:hypothetical protein